MAMGPFERVHFTYNGMLSIGVANIGRNALDLVLPVTNVLPPM